MPLFPKVIGQDDAKRRLFKAMQNNRLAHSYLILGEDGLGGLALALEAARALNCLRGVEAAAQNLCDCSSCRQMSILQHPQLMFLVPLPRRNAEKDEVIQKQYNDTLAVWAADLYGIPKLSGTGMILIDYVRELWMNLNLAADSFGMRCIIIYPAGRLNENAANTLLKLLEEPPERCLFFLLASSPRDLLPTIVSRCQQVVLKPLLRTEISDALIDRKHIGADVADSCARLAGGNYHRAATLAEGGINERLADGLQFLRAAATDSPTQISEIIENWTEKASRFDIAERLQAVAAWLHDALLAAALPTEEALEMLITSNETETVNKIAQRYTTAQLSQLWRDIEETRLALEANVVQSYALMALALKIHRVLR
ncbi:MAG: hypothetical protein FJY65_01340 [Calditrichaeota bacterium]|nr:hypothetical protein [Calditrichota bacterium]